MRLGLDAGAIFEIRDPILGAVTFTGAHISWTERIEPSTPPGEVYVTEAFAKLFILRDHGDLRAMTLEMERESPRLPATLCNRRGRHH